MVKTKEEINAYNREYYRKRKEKIGEYYKKTRQNYYLDNKEAYAIRSQDWYSNEDNKLKRREKIFSVEFQILFIKQRGLCALGGEPLPDNKASIHIDHDHETGLIRGLLCRSHNVGLGMFGESWELLEKASKYIFDWKVRALNGY